MPARAGTEASAAQARRIPMLDLAAEDREAGEAVRAAIADVLASRQYILGPHVERSDENPGPLRVGSESPQVAEMTSVRQEHGREMRALTAGRVQHRHWRGYAAGI